ncbi:short-chain dehydrogenase [Pedobacter psychrophilus]|uniref:Short-chain dehydrogenase n=1 Tax=Pedobacter psychrophilus TaxID=1826909 RepID=A0A179DTA9_9SPHI|nr:SDR family oxidoreductase [Pedobacter psychrophilus]OAQ43659.1 short-chain dehydrogenase [Pedobacter psychrophilus]
MKVALVTGANRGIGFETAKQLAQLGHFVYIGCRDKSLGQQAVEKLHKLGLINTETIVIDITKVTTITEAKKVIETKSNRLDILVNNAGILGTVPQPAATTSVDEIRRIFDTNFFGTIQVTQEFIPLLEKSEAGRIVNVTSDLSSLTLHNDPTWKFYPFKSAGYSVSKTALNGYTIMLAFGLKDSKIKVNAVNPGHTATDFNNHRGDKIPDQTAGVIVKYATIDNDGPNGKFFNEDGEMPW